MRHWIATWIRRFDPEHAALRRAFKLAVVSPVALATAQVVSGDPQTGIFASFGTIALLLFVDFPGDRPARLGAYIGLATASAALIVVGTLASEVAVVAVAAMAAVGFLITFAGVLSAASAAATRAALLAFVLPVTIPAEPSEIGHRLLGWLIAAVLSIPAAVWWWPPRDSDAIRARSAAACRALGAELDALADPERTADGSSSTAAVDELRTQFRSAASRPVGLTSGSRYLTHVVGQMEWLNALIVGLSRETLGRRRDDVRDLVRSCAALLAASAAALTVDRGDGTRQARMELLRAASRLHARRREVVDTVGLLDYAREVALADAAGLGGGADAARPENDRPDSPRAEAAPPDVTGRVPSLVYELIVTSQAVAGSVMASALADARPLVDRLLGRRPRLDPESAAAWDAEPADVASPLRAAGTIAARRLTTRSVWLRNSVRAAVGLAIAVLIVEIAPVSHSFWVVLGTLSVLRTTAITTGATALRALLGTFAGFLVGAGLVAGLGTAPAVLWTLLPLAVFVSGFAPLAISFAAGQAAFTVLVVILFNIVQPVGWSVGLVRIEDVAIGCAAGLLSGLLLWPVGAAAQIRSTLSDTCRTAALALQLAVKAVLEPTAAHRDQASEALRRAQGDTGRLDDALRDYLNDRGRMALPVDDLVVVSNVVSRLWIVAEAAQEAVPPPAYPAALDEARAGVESATASTVTWYRGVAAVIADAAGDIGEPPPPQAEPAVLRALAATPPPPAPAPPGSVRLWEVALHVDGLSRLSHRMAPRIRALAPTGGGSDPDATA